MDENFSSDLLIEEGYSVRSIGKEFTIGYGYGCKLLFCYFKLILFFIGKVLIIFSLKSFVGTIISIIYWNSLFYIF